MMRVAPWVDVPESHVCTNFMWKRGGGNTDDSLILRNNRARVEVTPVSLSWYKTLRAAAGRSSEELDTLLCAATASWDETDSTLCQTVSDENVPDGVNVSAARILFAGELRKYTGRIRSEQQSVGLAALSLSYEHRTDTDVDGGEEAGNRAAEVTGSEVEDVSAGRDILERDPYLSDNIVQKIGRLDAGMGLTELPHRRTRYQTEE